MSLITSFQDMQNLVLWRLRARGVNFGNMPGNAANDQNPPALIKGLLNAAYSEFLSRTLDSGIAVLKCYFLTTANATAYSLRPLPVFTDGVTPNPAALRVLEGTYTTQVGGQNGGYEYKFDLVSSKRFGAVTGNYTRRLSWFGPRVIYASQLYGRPQLEVAPGTATAGDTIALTIVPDPANSPITVPATSGGPLQLATDLPLFPQQFHMALVEWAVWQGGMAADKQIDTTAAKKAFDGYVLDAQTFGSNFGSGDPETGVLDIYAGIPLGE